MTLTHWGCAAILSWVAITPSLHAADWQGELTPYLWTAGIDGDVSVRGQKVEAEEGFENLSESIDMSGAFLGVLQRGNTVMMAQYDTLSIDTDELARVPEGSFLESNVQIVTLAAGIQLEGAKGKTYDVLLGARRLQLDNEITLNGADTLATDQHFNDIVVVIRPSVPLSQKWRFNPTLSVGAGDSNSTYELQPQVQYQLSTTLALRVGYRSLYYDLEGKRENAEFDGAFQGMLIGLGGMF